jgi:hypothetical protein
MTTVISWPILSKFSPWKANLYHNIRIILWFRIFRNWQAKIWTSQTTIQYVTNLSTSDSKKIADDWSKQNLLYYSVKFLKNYNCIVVCEVQILACQFLNINCISSIFIGWLWVHLKMTSNFYCGYHNLSNKWQR